MALILKINKKHFFYHFNTTIFSVAFAVFITLFFASAVTHIVPEPIELHPQALSIVPKEFYFAQMEDNRPEQKAIAWIYPVTNFPKTPTLQAVDLKGGGLAAIQNFMLQSFPQNKKLRPVLIGLKECKITESIQVPGRIEGKVALALTFSLIGEDVNVYLTDYRINTKYTRSTNQANFAEVMLSNSLNAAIKFFDYWINSQANNNPKLAKDVKVTFKEYQEKLEGDTIYYNINRQLTWQDFQKKPPQSKYAAVVFPSFGFEEKSEIVNGTIVINLEMKTYVPKSACWVKDGSRNDYTLNHEQRHFDVVKIVEKRFQQKVHKAQLPVGNYDGIINVQFYDSFREMNRLQEQYDNETQHCINTVEQERWNKRIDQDLAAVGIRKTNS